MKTSADPGLSVLPPTATWSRHAAVLCSLGWSSRYPGPKCSDCEVLGAQPQNRVGRWAKVPNAPPLSLFSPFSPPFLGLELLLSRFIQMAPFPSEIEGAKMNVVFS